MGNAIQSVGDTVSNAGNALVGAGQHAIGSIASNPAALGLATGGLSAMQGWGSPMNGMASNYLNPQQQGGQQNQQPGYGGWGQMMNPWGMMNGAMNGMFGQGYGQGYGQPVSQNWQVGQNPSNGQQYPGVNFPMNSMYGNGMQSGNFGGYGGMDGYGGMMNPGGMYNYMSNANSGTGNAQPLGNTQISRFYNQAAQPINQNPGMNYVL